MSLIPDDQRERIRSELAEKLVSPVRVIMFTQAMECKFCADTKQLVYELAELNEKIQAEVHDFVADAQLAHEYGVDRIPAIVIRSEKDYGIRFFGFPYGYEFQTLMEALASVSRGQTDLSEQTKQKLREIKVPINIKVFTTLTCPHCPTAAAMAHKFAIENSLITAEAIDAGEFSDMAIKYGVMGVPKVVINEKVEFVGAVPEEMFLEQVLKATA
ncbi:MAG TPA: thioredoxin family protein [candidate division Zixibacteria bacterium]|nr:thioredoxin family protein [candidate division Zixibacteria bacterium]